MFQSTAMAMLGRCLLVFVGPGQKPKLFFFKLKHIYINSNFHLGAVYPLRFSTVCVTL